MNNQQRSTGANDPALAHLNVVRLIVGGIFPAAAIHLDRERNRNGGHRVSVMLNIPNVHKTLRAQLDLPPLAPVQASVAGAKAIAAHLAERIVGETIGLWMAAQKTGDPVCPNPWGDESAGTIEIQGQPGPPPKR